MKREQKDHGAVICAGAVIVLISLLAVLNMGLLKGPVEQLIAGNITFEQFTQQVQTAYTSSFFHKDAFVNLNGLFVRATGRRVHNNVVLLENGMLTAPTADHDMEPKAELLKQFDTCLKEMGIPFLYVQAPYKVDVQDTLLPEGVEDYGNKISNDILMLLQERGVDTLDLRPQLAATPELVEQHFFHTDHHWNGLGAFVGFQQMTQRLEEMFPEEELDVAYTELSQWEAHTIEGIFLGSQGKRVGVYFGGTDDLTYYTPKFDTQMSLIVNHHKKVYQGDFAAANLRMDHVAEVDYFGENPYCIYIGGDYPLAQHRNALAPNALKVLIIKDSFTLPLQGYFSTLFQEVDVVDPRYYDNTKLTQYVKNTKPDVVIELASPLVLSSNLYFDFGADHVTTYETMVPLDVEQQIILEDNGGNNYTYQQVSPVEYGTTYTFHCDEVVVTQGEAAGVYVAVFNKTQNTFVASEIFDAAYSNGQGTFDWTFTTPDGGTDELALLVYAGIHGETAGKGVIYRGVTLSRYQ